MTWLDFHAAMEARLGFRNGQVDMFQRAGEKREIDRRGAFGFKSFQNPPVDFGR